jgi:Arf-GAP/coiled-coil/ANK repeat/PH domain-containing protein
VCVHVRGLRQMAAPVLVLIPPCSTHIVFISQPLCLGEDTMTVMEEDLRLCTVKPVLEGDRRFCFEVLSPTK